MISYILVFIIVTLIAYIWLQLRRKLNFFKDRGIPYVKGYPLVGNFGRLMLRLETFGEFILRICEDYKELPMFGMFSITGPTYMIRDLEMIKQITSTYADNFINRSMAFKSHHEADTLFTNSLLALRDEKWKKMRALVSPSFTSSKIRTMFNLVQESINNMMRYFNENLRSDGTIEVAARETFARAAINSIASAALGLKIDCLRDKEHIVYKSAMKQVSNDINLRLVLITAFPWLGNKLNMSIFDPESTAFFKKVINDTVRNRQETNVSRPDVIQLLMAEMDKLTNDELTAQAFIFFIGGFEGVSQTIQHTMYELALNQDHQQTLYKEIQSVKAKLSGRPLSYDELNDMKYLDAFINEVFRKKINFLMERECNTDTIITDSNGQQHKIEAGTSVIFPLGVISLDYRIYPNPERFDPSHFLGDNRIKQGPMHAPFGLGPRNCIGMRFALMKVKLVVYSIVSEFVVQPCIKTQIPMRPNKGFTNLLSKPIIVELKKRLE